jgi:hypothetical protein
MIFILLLLPALTFVIYGYRLGGISKNPSDWGSFGSLLSGVFSVIASVAAIGTLLYFGRQLEEQRSSSAQQLSKIESQFQEQIRMNKVQEESLIFERYTKHRNLFSDSLRDIESSFSKKFIIDNHSELYARVFKKNSPRKCIYDIDLEREPVDADDLGDMLCLYKRIVSGRLKSQGLESSNLILTDLVHLMSQLNMRYIGTSSEGDIIWFGNNSGVNTYRIDEFVLILNRVLSLILQYAGRESLPDIVSAGPSLGRQIRVGIKQHFTSNSVLSVFKEIIGLDDLENFYIFTEKLRREDKRRLLNEIYIILASVFSEHSNILRLRDKEAYSQLLEKCISALEENWQAIERLSSPEKYSSIWVRLSEIKAALQ